MGIHTSRGLAAAAVLALTLSACSSHGGHDGAEQAAASTQTAGQHDMSAMGESLGDGLAAKAGGFEIAEVAAPKTTGREGTLEFVINGPAGKPHKAFVLELSKLMHTYVVRKDLTEFQHVHPELDEATGRWSVPITFAEPGPYRLVAEFEAIADEESGDLAGRVLGSEFTVGGGSYRAAEYSPSFGKASVDGYDLSLEPQARLHGPDLTLKVTKGGADVKDLQPYLESWAHVTGFRRDNLQVVHMHPQQSPGKDVNAAGGPTLNLASMFKTPGKYRLFVQFQTAGKLRTAPIDIELTDDRQAGADHGSGH
ncbi:MAG: hypothetical protein ACT4QF_03800 [Sporichthyaceae bacterium]